MGVLAPESASKNFKVTFWDGLFQVERSGELNYSTSPHWASWGLMSSDILQERLSIGVPCGGGRTLFPPICTIQCNMDIPPHSTSDPVTSHVSTPLGSHEQHTTLHTQITPHHIIRFRNCVHAQMCDWFHVFSESRSLIFKTLHTKCKTPHISCKMKHCIQNSFIRLDFFNY